MISDRCDFEDFVLETKGREYQEIIYLAEREATEAERRFYHPRQKDSEKSALRTGLCPLSKGVHNLYALRYQAQAYQSGYNDAPGPHPR